MALGLGPDRYGFDPPLGTYDDDPDLPPPLEPLEERIAGARREIARLEAEGDPKGASRLVRLRQDVSDLEARHQRLDRAHGRFADLCKVERDPSIIPFDFEE